MPIYVFPFPGESCFFNLGDLFGLCERQALIRDEAEVL